MEFLPTNISDDEEDTKQQDIVNPLQYKLIKIPKWMETECETANMSERKNEWFSKIVKGTNFTRLDLMTAQNKAKLPQKKRAKPVEQTEQDSDTECEIDEVEVVGDSTIELCETFDQNRLNHILNHQEEYKKQMRPGCFDNDYNPFTILSKYLKKSKCGKIKVNYKQTNSLGRFYAIGSLSLQSMPREIRHTVATNYVDIDMVNAHPVILQHLCHGRDMKPKQLARYVEDRDKMLGKLKIDRDSAKTVILSMINGGHKAYNELTVKPQWLEKFKKEIDIIHRMFATDRQFERHVSKREEKGLTNNHKASYMNTLLCDYENKILHKMYEFFGQPDDCVLCFDGIMLREGEYDLKGCQDYVYNQLGIKIELKIKPMSDGFTIDNPDLYTEPRTELYADFETLVNRELYKDTVDSWCKNSIVLINNGGNHFFLTKNKRIDSMTDEESVYYKQVTEQNIMNNLRVACYIINDEFDYNFWLANKHLKPRDIEPEDRIKMAKYSFKSLGVGYLSEAVKCRELVSYNHVEFYPYLKKNGEPKLYDCFNIFTGFPLEKVPLTVPITFEDSLLYKHLGDEMMNGEMGEFNHFLDHIADMIQMPHLIRGPSHLFYTAPGMGKGMMAVLMNRLLGSNHVITFGDTATYFSNFNSEQANKILKIFEEVSDKGDAFHKHDRLKGDQTKTQERIEPKGIDAYNIRHCARYWYYTNNPNALYIENNDRRHTLHRANNRYANKTEYFNELWKLVKDEAFCRMVFEYFSNRVYTEKNVLIAYDSKYKNEQKLSNMPNGIKYLKELVEDNFTGVERNGEKINAKSLAGSFKEWCSDNGTKFSLSAFKSQILKIGIDEPKNLRINGRQTKCYHMNVDEMRTSFREFLKDDNFEFDITPMSDDDATFS